MVTFNRLDYTRQAVESMLSSSRVSAEFVLWDNASTDGTREWLIERLADDPRVSLMLSNSNCGCVHPMNAIWGSARTPLVAKVDNDTLIPPDLLAKLAEMHARSQRWGVLSGCHFRPEDLTDDVLSPSGPRGAEVYRQPHVGGCAVMMRRSVFARSGAIPCLHDGSPQPFLESTWTEYQQRLDQAGLVNGYPLPLMFVEHMEDTRSPHCVRTAEHELYKAQMRGRSLAECTAQMYVDGARKALQRGEPIGLDEVFDERTTSGDSDQLSERVTLFIPLAGRTSLWPELAAFLDRQSWPRERTSLILLDTSQSVDFGDQILGWIAQCDFPDVRLLRDSVGAPGLADAPRRSVTPDVRRAMAQIYQRLQSVLQTEYVWILEDDILPPDDVCERLMQLLGHGYDSAAGPYRSRFGERFVVWDREGRNVTVAPRDVRRVGGNGFGCALLRSETLLRTAFSVEQDCDRTFYSQLQAHGGSAAVDWTCLCQHRDAAAIEATFVSDLDRAGCSEAMVAAAGELL